MTDRTLPAHPSLDQYKKQAKELVRAVAGHDAGGLARIRKHHPRLKSVPESEIEAIALADAQLVLAREHGYDSWPQFSKHIEILHIIRSVENLPDPVSTFLEVASVERHGGHSSGTLEHANLILERYPDVAGANIFTAAILGDDARLSGFLAHNRDETRSLATTRGGPLQWDPLTYLCFSRYLRIDRARSEGFVRAARALLEAGASANACWYDAIDDPPRQAPETAIYGAAGIAQHAGVTRLLLEYGADPNDEETPYHVPETGDNTVLEIILDSGRFNASSLATVLARKADWHDEKGLALALAHGANPNFLTAWKVTPFQHAIRRDNSLAAIEQFLEYGADPLIRNKLDHRDAFQMAAYHGRGDVMDLFMARGFTVRYDEAIDRLVAACARADRPAIDQVIHGNALVADQLLEIGGTLLSRFAGAGNLAGLRALLDLGISANSLWADGDPYWSLAKDSRALHSAAWRARHDVVCELIARGAEVNATDARGRTPLQLAVGACLDSYWKASRKPDSVAALLAAGAATDGIDLPSGYEAIDELLIR